MIFDSLKQKKIHTNNGRANAYAQNVLQCFLRHYKILFSNNKKKGKVRDKSTFSTIADLKDFF